MQHYISIRNDNGPKLHVPLKLTECRARALAPCDGNFQPVHLKFAQKQITAEQDRAKAFQVCVCVCVRQIWQEAKQKIKGKRGEKQTGQSVFGSAFKL